MTFERFSLLLQSLNHIPKLMNKFFLTSIFSHFNCLLIKSNSICGIEIEKTKDRDLRDHKPVKSFINCLPNNYVDYGVKFH